jgi:hypothetical protein
MHADSRGVDGRGLDGKMVGRFIGCRSIFSGILEEIWIFTVIVVGQNVFGTPEGWWKRRSYALEVYAITSIEELWPAPPAFPHPRHCSAVAPSTLRHVPD